MQYFRVIARLSQMRTKAFFRDKVAMLFTFIFPLIFLLVFGALNRNNNGTSFDVAIINQSKAPFAQAFAEQTKKSKFVKPKDFDTLDEAKAKMARGELDTILLLPPEFGQPDDRQLPQGQAIVYYDPSSAQTGQTFATIIDGQLREIGADMAQQKPLFSVAQKSTDTRGLKAFDFTFAGLIGFSILSLGFFGPTNSLPGMKKQGSLRRLRTTPLRTSQFVLANALTYLIIGLVAVVLMFITGVLLFDFQMQGDYLSFILVVVLGILTMFGFGLAIGGWAKNENQAAPLANLLAFPMMFLSGTFFPRFLMPEWLQKVSGFLPLTPLVDSVRFILTEGKTIFDLGPQLALLGAWALVIYVVAFRVFRWE
jgi:ABC-2 type transport system permease protein